MDIIIQNTEGLPDEIVQKAIAMMNEENPNRTMTEISIRSTGNPDEYGIIPIFRPVPFQRIRRITGYLVGTVDRFNNAKAAEVRDRVKHTL